MDIRQSDLASFQRCAKQKHYHDQARAGIGVRPANLSATVYGTVMHHAVQVLETQRAAGAADALLTAKSTFAHYWDPSNLVDLSALHPELVHGVDTWLPRQTYGGMRMAGLMALDDYYELLCADDSTLLALELQFRVPLDLGEHGQHVLTGTVDRLAIRRYNRKPYLSIEDFKTGKKPTFLRYNLQFSAYCWASTQQEFWVDFPDAYDRWHLYEKWARRGRWIDLKKGVPNDAGWRGEQDYLRMKLGLTEYVRAVEADIYPLTMAGDVCLYCPFRDTCGGVPVPDEDYGKPA